VIGLTPRQRDLLAFIEGFIARNGYGPSYDEMRAGIGIKGKGRIFELLTALEERGRIRRARASARAIEVLRPGHAFINGQPYRFIPIGGA